MTTTIQAINPAAFGHDGICDHDAGCCAPASHIVASGTAPDLWADGAPAASIAFVCLDHRLVEPIATREDAERTADAATEACSLEINRAWRMLLMVYPNPIPLVVESEEGVGPKVICFVCSGLPRAGQVYLPTEEGHVCFDCLKRLRPDIAEAIERFERELLDPAYEVTAELTARIDEVLTGGGDWADVYNQAAQLIVCSRNTCSGRDIGIEPVSPCTECGVALHHHQDIEHGSVWLCLNPTCIRDK